MASLASPLLLSLTAASCQPGTTAGHEHLTSTMTDTLSQNHAHTNALVHESSPYLLQHAHNPVDWQPWSEEAWKKAETEGKLVVVSIGYSACHWCHVMEHETFEDDEAAALMNEHFVCIKVDREERPDVDGVYMTAVQLMTKRGGWPLNAICLPDGRPIYGGTYFPRQRWMEALQSVLTAKATDPEHVEAYATQLAAGVSAAELVDIPPLEGSKAWGTPDAFGNADRQLLTDGIAQWKQYWDPKWGGNNRAPKFPIPTNMDFLLHYGTVRGDQTALDHAKQTLLQMERGGIHDHIGGGFARYSVDEKWHVPHFEKMLYDNGQLAATFARAYQALTDAKPDERAALKRGALGIVSFVEREWNHPSGGFLSALDADSEGVEGKYYVWTEADLRSLLSAEEFELIRTVYGIGGASAWTEEIPDANVLMRWKGDEALANKLNLRAPEMREKLESVHAKMLNVRDQRIPPGLDDKVLTAWTALMASGLVATGVVFEREQDIERAQAAMDFILKTQRDDDGRLSHVFHEQTGPRIDGFLDDYGCVIGACLDLYQATFEVKYANAARQLCEQALADFYDAEAGTFWFTRSTGEPLFARKQENDDSVMPSANAQMARNLFLLSALFDQRDWRVISDRMLAGALDRTDYWPSATHWAGLLLWRTENFREVVITSPKPGDFADLRNEMQREFRPGILWAGGSTENLPLLDHRVMDSQAIFVCEDGACQLPVKNAVAAAKLFD